jgi:purine-binding chemotaxis protein CheW
MQSLTLETVSNTPKNVNQYLTFNLGAEEYGIEILKIQEIRSCGTVTKIPNTPDYILGVINLRGAIIPVLDLRIRFGLKTIEYTATTVIIVTRMRIHNVAKTVGLVVDAVSEVYNIDDSQLAPPPDFGVNVDTNFVSHLANIEDKMIIIMAIENLISHELLAKLPDSKPSGESQP